MGVVAFLKSKHESLNRLVPISPPVEAFFMGNVMKAIETVYKGYRFRSRLEARWAVFFNYMGLQWVYEDEGYVTESKEYHLPDFTVFRLGKKKINYEIKPKNFEGDIKSCFLLKGDPYDCLATDGLSMCPRCGDIQYGGISVDGYKYGPMGSYYGHIGYGWDCERCDFETPCGNGNEKIQGLVTMVEPYKGIIVLNYEEYALWKDHFCNAVIKARQARFEHGEAP